MKKLKNLILLAMCLLCANNTFAQYFEEVDDFLIKDYKFDDFSKIDVANPIKVLYKSLPDSAGCVVVSGNKDLMKELTIKSEKGVFHARLKKKHIEGDTLVINIYSNTLESVACQSGAIVNINSSVDAPEFTIKADGEGIVICKEVNCGIFKVNSKDNGRIVVNNGKCGMGQYSLAGKGTVQVFLMSAEATEVAISGSGSVRCQSLKTLDVSITGSGKLYYTGSPRIKARIPTPSQIAAF